MKTKSGPAAVKKPRNHFLKQEMEFLRSNYIARIATCGHDLSPHVTPIYFANDRASIFFATEKNTKKYEDIMQNERVSLVVDIFDAEWLHGDKNGSKTTEKAVLVHGVALPISKGKTYNLMYGKLLDKYPDYRTSENWEKGELPIMRVAVRKITSWGFS